MRRCLEVERWKGRRYLLNPAANLPHSFRSRANGATSGGASKSDSSPVAPPRPTIKPRVVPTRANTQPQATHVSHDGAPASSKTDMPHTPPNASPGTFPRRFQRAPQYPGGPLPVDSNSPSHTKAASESQPLPQKPVRVNSANDPVQPSVGLGFKPPQYVNFSKQRVVSDSERTVREASDHLDRETEQFVASHGRPPMRDGWSNAEAPLPMGHEPGKDEHGRLLYGAELLKSLTPDQRADAEEKDVNNLMNYMAIAFIVCCLFSMIMH